VLAWPRQGAQIKPYHFLVTADPQAHGGPPRHGARSRRVGPLIALLLGLAGLAVSLTGLTTQLLPRQFTAAQSKQIEAWQIASRWRTLTAGQVFPASVTYQLSPKVLGDAAPLYLDALRVGIAPQAGCNGGVTTAAAPVLRRHGCEAILRATYIDATRSYVMTVGVAVFPTAAAAVTADQGLSQPRLAVAHDTRSAQQLAAGVLVVRFNGPAGTLYNYSRQISKSFADGPYLVMYAAGYSDNRPRVRVSEDYYSDAEMTSLAQGVAQSVANTLAAPPAPPHCPGAPGC
jgi:hypothetical protein